METKLAREQYQELEEQCSRTPAQPDAESMPGEHFKLIALLNRFGFFPGSKQEALDLAKKLLEQGWDDSIET
jgi:hypothetical protein